MRFANKFFVVAFVILLIAAVKAQAQTETSRAVEGGGISVPGWTGKIDANEEKAGQGLKNAKLAQEGNALHVTTGPAVTYWNPANKATGNYTVKATFKESKYMNLNSHPHPYGIVIAGNGLGTDKQNYLYCAAYGNGTFIVRKNFISRKLKSSWWKPTGRPSRRILSYSALAGRIPTGPSWWNGRS